MVPPFYLNSYFPSGPSQKFSFISYTERNENPLNKLFFSVFQQVVHLNLAEDCMNKFKPNIEKLCKTEQVSAESETSMFKVDFQN